MEAGSGFDHMCTHRFVCVLAGLLVLVERVHAKKNREPLPENAASEMRVLLPTDRMPHFIDFSFTGARSGTQPYKYRKVHWRPISKCG